MRDVTLDWFVDAHTLAERLDRGEAGLRLVDLRDEAAFDAGHIAGAHRLDRQLLNRSEPPFNGLLPELAMARRLVQSIDLREGQQVVAIDAGKATDAARLAWVLDAYALPDTCVLDGGMAAWQAADLPVETTAASASADDARPPATPMLSAANRVTADELLGELADPQLRILDVRSAAEFDGTDVRSAVGGHVPGARHLEWTRQLDNDGTLRSADALRAELQALDVTPEHRVVVYCQSHQRSSVTWQVLRSLGYADVRGLDGAWSVWGNRMDLPKES